MRDDFIRRNKWKNQGRVPEASPQERARIAAAIEAGRQRRRLDIEASCAPTRAQLEQAGARLRATYVGPFPLELAAWIRDDLKRARDWRNRPVFGALVLIRQGYQGYNVVEVL